MSTRKFETLLVAGALTLAGCGSPPSVTPLLRVAQSTLLRESQQLEQDQRMLAGVERQTLAALEQAFEADVRQAPTLEARWVLEAARAYALARDAVVGQGAAERQARQRRIENLLLAAEAQRRALNLLERQDALLMGVLGLDLWRLEPSPPLLQGEQP